MTRIGYYPGCSLSGSSRDFGESVEAVARALEVELVPVPEWSCCGASSAHVVSRTLALALPASVLARARAAGLDEVLAPCAACYNRLASVPHEVRSNPEIRKALEHAIEAPLDGLPRVVNVLEWLARHEARIASSLRQPFARTVACYYGCLLVRPPRVVSFDRVEDPRSMDALVAAAGGRTVAWGMKTECCGAAMSMPATGMVGTLGARIVADAARRGAEAIVVACPMCHSNLDLRRPAIAQALGASSDMPVLFVTQVVGLALGVPARTLGLERHMVPVRFAAPAVAS